jgi:RNA polymerase sigma-70 factor (ECF subfamily)
MHVDEEQTARFEAVYSDTYEHILGYAMRRCDTAEDAADVVAETFAVAWRRIDALPAGAAGRLWLFGVARNVLAQHLRGMVRLRSRNAELDEDVADLYAYSPEGSVELGTIATAFRELSDDDRELLSLVAWQGLDQAEISKVLDCSRNVVRVRLHRARRRFSQALTTAGISVNHFAMAGR